MTPPGFGSEWTGTISQQIEAGNLAPIVFGLAVIFVYLALAAQYKSWKTPLSILATAPIGVLGALLAARVRFRPILMTSFSFVLGTLPLLVATGVGAASRTAIGTAVFGGMLLATVVGVFFIPTLDAIVQSAAAAESAESYEMARFER